MNSALLLLLLLINTITTIINTVIFVKGEVQVENPLLGIPGSENFHSHSFLNAYMAP